MREDGRKNSVVEKLNTGDSRFGTWTLVYLINEDPLYLFVPTSGMSFDGRKSPHWTLTSGPLPQDGHKILRTLVPPRGRSQKYNDLRVSRLP